MGKLGYTVPSMKSTIVVEVTNIKVGRRSWSFNYRMWRNKKLIGENSLDGTHSRAYSTMKRYFEQGYGVELAIQHEF